MGLVKLSIVDTETGEVIEKRESKRKFKAEWFMSYMDGCSALAKMNLTKNEYRMIYMLAGKITYNNRLFINKADLAKEFKCARSMVYETIGLLEKKEIILKMGNYYKFNNTYIRCGGVKHEE